MDRLTKAQMEFMNGYVPANIHDVYEYAAGGGIHIDPSKKGTFKAQATRMNMGVQEAASHILANKDDYSSTMVKKANFARNFAKEEGGVAQGDQGNAQMMQAIQTYAQMIAQQSGEDPNKVYQELMGQLQQMKPKQQQAAMQEIVKQVQTASQQPAMQMGGDPSQMQQAPQQQGGDVEQLIQQIQQMLQQGAQPQEVIAQLLQLQIDPQMIVEIFVQLGMPQEQVVPVVQEVMQQMGGGQEQGMEEPAPQGMKDGGITKYPYGGMYANKKNYANFLPQDALNNAMTDINMLAGPTAAMANIKPLKGLAAATGIASGIAGAFQGYRGLFNGAVFGNKNKPATSYDKPATSYSVTGNATSNINPMTSSPVVGPQRFEDLPEAEQKWKGFPYMMQYGGLPDAQFGIPPGFDFNDPYGLQQPRFGQTANYGNTRGYTNGQPIRDRSTSVYSTPGFVEGMGVGQEGYGGADNSMYDNKFPKPPLAYEEPQAPDLTGLYPQLSKRQQRKQDAADLAYNVQKNKAITEDTTDYNTYKLKKSVLNEGKVNKKTANNISGRQIANNSLLALSAANFALGEDKRGPRPMTEAERQERMLNNPLNYAGIYTPNIQGGGNDYIPNRYTATQDYGTTGNVIARAGGQMNFAAGGQYKVSHEQLLQLLRDGAEIEFL